MKIRFLKTIYIFLLKYEILIQSKVLYFHLKINGRGNGKMKHTPGSWNRNLNYIFDTHNRGIATCYNMDGHGEANARLIASAPDLLEACEIAKSALDYAYFQKGVACLKELQFVESAIKKAKSET